MAETEELERENAKLKKQIEKRDAEIASLKNHITVKALSALGVDRDYATEILVRKHPNAVTLKEDGTIDEEQLDGSLQMIVDATPPKFIGDASADAAAYRGTYDPAADGRARGKAERGRLGLDGDDLAFR